MRTPATYEQALHAKNQVEPEWIREPGVTGLDVGVVEGTAGYAVRLYVVAPSAAANFPGEVFGVPVHVKVRRFEAH